MNASRVKSTAPIASDAACTRAWNESLKRVFIEPRPEPARWEKIQR